MEEEEKSSDGGEPGKAIIAEFARRLGHQPLEIYSRYLSLGMDLQTGKPSLFFDSTKGC